MEKIINKIIVLFISFLLVINVTFASELSLNSKSYILYNLNDNEIIDEKNIHDELNIASLTKIMTTIIAIENIGDSNYDNSVTITGEMVNNIAWDIHITGFKVGEKLTYNDLLYSAILDSGADAVNALAISTSGSYDKFISQMNQKVKDLGLKNTEFDNVIGKDSKHNYSSAYDLAQILMYALKNPKFKEVFTTQKYTLSNGIKVKRSVNQYAGSDISYITGAKTGYYDDALYCLATTASLNNVNYLFVSLGAYPKGQHLADHVSEYNYFNDNYSYKNIVNNDTKIVTLKTKYAKEKEIDINANVNKQKYLKNDIDLSKIEYVYNGTNEIIYNMKKGTKLGSVKILYEGKVFGEFDLLYNGTLTFSLLNYLWVNKIYVILITIVLLLLLRIIHVQIIRARRRKRRKSIKK